MRQRSLRMVLSFLCIFLFMLLIVIWKPTQKELQSQTLSEQSTSVPSLPSTEQNASLLSKATILAEQADLPSSTRKETEMEDDSASSSASTPPTKTSQTTTKTTMTTLREITTSTLSTTSSEPSSTSTTLTTSTTSKKVPTPADLQALRECETGNDYASDYGENFGAYNFTQPTWNLIADLLGRTDLVGTPPDTATPADQDLVALKLYEERGAKESWPVCGHLLE